MGVILERDPDGVLAGFEAWLRQRHPDDPPALVGTERPAVGYSTETILIDAARPSGAVVRLVLKLAPAGPAIFPTYDFVAQARVQEAAAAAGIPAPAPVQVELDPVWLGAPFLVMPAIAGHVVSEVPLFDRWLDPDEPARNAVVHGHYLDVLADINRLDWQAAGLDGVVPRRDAAAEVELWRRYLAWYAAGEDPAPRLGDALDWCAAHQPATEPAPSLRWGDVRLGNVIFDESPAPVAVLDWEMASIGSAEHDLAWMLALDGIQLELLGRAVPGFFDRDETIDRYQQRLGRPVQDLAWYEILALVRSSAILTRIAHLDEQAGRPLLFPVEEHPVLGILDRRVAEASR